MLALAEAATATVEAPREPGLPQRVRIGKETLTRRDGMRLPATAKGRTRVSKMQHAACVALLMFGAGGLLGWLAGHTEILFADGLRYIEQARQIDRGAWVDGLIRSVDHPIYPMAIAAAHRLDGARARSRGRRRPSARRWSRASCSSCPLYLVAIELFGAVDRLARLPPDVPGPRSPATSWPTRSARARSCSSGPGGSGRRSGSSAKGRFGWLPPTIGFGALAYLTRPEGLLLPAALVATLLLDALDAVDPD